MDSQAVVCFCPSLLVFCSIAFALMTALPRVRTHLKSQFDIALSEDDRDISYRDFFYYSFYLEATKAFDRLAFAYLFGALVVLLHPVAPAVALAGYSFVLCATMAIVVWLAVVGIKTHRAAVANARIRVNNSPVAASGQP